MVRAKYLNVFFPLNTSNFVVAPHLQSSVMICDTNAPFFSSNIGIVKMIYIHPKVKKSSNLLWIASFHKIALVTMMGSNIVPIHNTFSTIQTNCEQHQFKYLNWWFSYYLFCVRAIFSFILECVRVCVSWDAVLRLHLKVQLELTRFAFVYSFVQSFTYSTIYTFVIKPTRHKNVTPSFPGARAKWCEQFEISLFFLLCLCTFFFLFTFW